MVKDPAVTQDFYVLPAVVVVRDKKMQEPWCLAISRADLGAADVVKLYGRRFTIETAQTQTIKMQRASLCIGAFSSLFADRGQAA